MNTNGRDEFIQMVKNTIDGLISNGDRAACDKYGKSLAAVTADGKFNELLPVLEDFRARYRVRFAGPQAAVQPVRPAAPLTSAVPEGTFTVEHPDGSYETVKIEVIKDGGLKGKRIASHISGPDNETDFTGFAFVNDNRTISVWKKKANIDPRWVKAVQTVLLAGDTGEMAEAYAIRSGRCARCNRTLTVPTSLHQGYGPECIKKVEGQMALAA